MLRRNFFSGTSLRSNRRETESQKSNSEASKIEEGDSYDWLIKAVKSNDIERAKALLKSGAKTRILLGDWRCSYHSPLHFAVRNSNFDMVKLLCEAKDSDVNYTGDGNWTPLHEVNNPKIVDFLIEEGAEINPRNNFGYTPLFLTIVRGELDAAKALLRHKADGFVLSDYDLISDRRESAHCLVSGECREGKYKNKELTESMEKIREENLQNFRQNKI